MIDLSHLTEEEKNMILAVLKRDAELKQAEETRIRSLQKSERDKAKLKYLTGEWFYETKSKRHQDRIHGSDIIRASMRQRKGVTILELSQVWTEKPSFVNSDNKEVFVPPELSGLIEEPAPRNNHDREDICNPADMLKPVLQSPTKQRRNPFNSQASAAETLESVASQLTNGAMEQAKTPGCDSLPSSSCSSPRLTNPQPQSSENRVQPNAPVPIPVPRKRTIIRRSHDSLLEIDGPAYRQDRSHAPRGILKHNSSCSSTDSLPLRLASNHQPTPQIPVTPNSPTNPLPSRESAGWLDRKQVRFSSAVGRGGIEWSPELQDGKELGEHSLLDLDVTAPSEGDPKTVHEDLSRDSEDDGQGFPVSPLQDEEEASPCIGSPSCKEVLNTQTQVTGSTHVLVDQRKHDDHAEPPPPKESDSGTADQTPGDEDASPLRTKLKAMPQRPMSFSKSLEDLTSRSSTLPPRPPSLSDSEDMKMISASVSALPQEEKDGRDSDCTSESSLYLGWRRNANSLCNLSLSSGMVSMSSAGSMVSIYSGEHGDVEVKGSIQLALNYVQKLGEFHIFVVHCRELAVADPKKSRSNPYIKCYLLPDKAKMGKKKTSVKNKTLNPTYNEILRFKVTMETLKTQKLNVSVWHNDNFGRNSFLGELELDLTEWDFNNTQINEYTLKPRVSTLTHSPSDSQSVDGRGEMRVALRFLPRVSYSKRPSKLEAGEMQVWVKDCKNLPPVRGVIIDPFVKCAVLPDSGRRTRQKTRVVKRTTSPMFNHTMVYDGFRSDDLREIAMEITVWDHDRLSNHFIGGLRIGLGSGRSYGADVAWMDSTEEEARLWERMMQAQSEWVEAVLPLRMLLMARAGAK
ncbi:synaptotagmin-like protein 2 [Osmerus mordax]|uniref:synaptotagmin-like protein 2 n=1 Tax=Osmerus mordax TaxID=8014 RepID=UPI0035105372